MYTQGMDMYTQGVLCISSNRDDWMEAKIKTQKNL